MTNLLRLKEVTGSLFLQARPQFYLQHHDLWHVYSLRNDPDPEMIPTFLLVDPGVIPKELGNGD